uniref:PIP49_C domain-containing protein n=1 Tax=Rhabditophanes sp. KR3021 TaxID=114890 RepID=A0AC35U8T9_9BILA
MISSCRANSVLNNVCDLFATSQISGQTCSLICDSESAIITDYQIGNDKHVLFIKVNGTTKIFKTLHPYFHEYDPLPNDLSEDAFKMAILEKVNNQTFLDFPIAFKDHVVSTIYSSFPTTQISLADKKSIWALLQEPEFINFKILKLSRVVPNIKSTCGHFYEVQNLLPFSMKSYYMNLKSKILLHLMGTLKLFYEFLNEPLEWCDATFENLALSTEYVKRFVIMDADQLYTRAKLNKLLTAKTCQHNDDCTIKDCHSTCLNNKCSERVNENLDVFCDKMVHQLYGNFYSKNNKFLTACNNNKFNRTKRLDDLRLAWAWTIPDV